MSKHWGVIKKVNNKWGAPNDLDVDDNIDDDVGNDVDDDVDNDDDDGDDVTSIILSPFFTPAASAGDPSSTFPTSWLS